MKYLIISDYASINGGGAKVAISTAIGLANAGNEVIFFAGGGTTQPDLCNNKNINVINLGLPDLINGSKLKMLFNGVYNRKVYKKLKEILINCDNDVIIHVHAWMRILSPSIFKALNKCKKNFFITAHDYFLICPNGGFYNYPKGHICTCKERKKCFFVNCDSNNYLIKIWRYIRSYVQTRLLKKSKYSIFTLSELMKNQFSEKNIETQIVRNPISMTKEKNKVLELKTHSFAYIGRLSLEKGVELFCDALKETGYQGYIFGDGPLKNYLTNKYKDVPNINFMGWMDLQEISLYFDKVLALVFPSVWYEGAPLTIPEVGSYGIPAIVSDSCSGVDYINGKTGMIFKSGDVNDLINKMNKALDVFPSIQYRLNCHQETLENNNDLIKYIHNLLKKYNN